MNLITRAANEKDTLLYFNWVNEIITRKYSFNSGKISFENHEKWFLEKLKDENVLLLVFEDQNKNQIGQVRLEKKTNENIIGISIDFNFRGKGFAYEMIIKACKLFFKKYKKENYILAYIKNENIASINSFLKSGFINHKTENNFHT
jgi:RimJ/RimL family protein N-acetyltransferase